MTTKGNRRNGVPHLVTAGVSNKLERISLNTKLFDETWMQKLIHDNPDLLPISDIDPGFSPAISIGREISTPVGNIDNLFITAEGYLTIVETKLWRNPEARREVVGQILDYAKELTKWSFADLDKCVQNYNRLANGNPEGLLEMIRKKSELDEAEELFFIDNVSKNLKRGRFLLLIVGDGIRESVEDMVEYLAHSPQIHFTLALVELQVFSSKGAENQLFVLPQLVTRTREITRAIVRIEGSQADVKVLVETDFEENADKRRNGSTRRLTISAQDFFDQLAQNTSYEMVEFANQIIKDSEDLGLYIEWNSGSFSIKLPDPLGSGVKVGILNIDRAGLVYTGLSRGPYEKLQISREPSYSFAADTAELLDGIGQNAERKHLWNKYSTLADLKKVYKPFMLRVREYIDDILEASQVSNDE